MPTPHPLLPGAIAFALTLSLSPLLAQTGQSAPAGTAAKSSAPARTSSAGSKTLPDPALLDGSKLPPDKRPDYGMIGDFDIPGSGDENSKSDRVGGNPGQKSQGSGPEGQVNVEGKGKGSGKNDSPGENQGGSESGQLGAGGPASQNASKQGQANPNAKGSQPGGSQGSGGTVGSAEGVQVAGLESDGTQGSASSDPTATSGKPAPVALGDATMVIKQAGTQQQTVADATKSAGAAQQSANPGNGRGAGSNGGGSGRGSGDRGLNVPPGL